MREFGGMVGEAQGSVGAGSVLFCALMGRVCCNGMVALYLQCKVGGQARDRNNQHLRQHLSVESFMNCTPDQDCTGVAIRGRQGRRHRVRLYVLRL